MHQAIYTPPATLPEQLTLTPVQEHIILLQQVDMIFLLAN